MGWVAWESGRPHWFKDGIGPNGKSIALPVAQSGYTPQKGIEKVPMIRDLMKTETDKQIADLLGSASIIGRSLVLPPAAPQWLVPVLRKSFNKVVKDKVLQGRIQTRSRGEPYIWTQNRKNCI